MPVAVWGGGDHASKVSRTQKSAAQAVTKLGGYEPP